MRWAKREHKRTDRQMVVAHSVVEDLPTADTEHVLVTEIQVLAYPSQSDDYWARAMGRPMASVASQAGEPVVMPSGVPAPQPSKRQDAPVKARRRHWRFVPVAALASALIAGLGGGAAYAYFTSTGSGTGSATTGTLSAVAVTAATGTPSTPLVPGGSGDVILKVSNPNPYAVTLVSVSGSGTITAAGGIAACTTTGVTFTNQSSLNDTITASTTTQVDLTGAASMSTASQTGCQGATFSIPVTITVHR